MESETHIKRIVLDRLDRCSVCHRSYASDDLQVLSRKPDMWMMLVRCADCQSRNFVAAVLNDGDAAEARLALRRLSDEGADVAEAVAKETPPLGDPINAGDVIDMHQFLHGFDGDFSRLFRRR